MTFTSYEGNDNLEVQDLCKKENTRNVKMMKIAEKKIITVLHKILSKESGNFINNRNKK